jgi:hypothetical protein
MSSFTIADLEAAIDQFGADVETWPATAAAGARQLLDASAEARDLLAQAVQLDQALRGQTAKAPSGLVDRIAAAASRLPQHPGKPRR